MSNPTICGIFGNPVRHTASPAMHNAAYHHLGIDSLYLAFEIKPQNLKKAIESIRVLNFSGVNITIPYKEAVIPFLDELTTEAQLVGAVNTIKNEDGKLIGYNTDAEGFEKALKEEWGQTLKKAHLVLIGAGGAARAVAVQAALSGVSRITLINRGKERLRALMRYLKDHFPKLDIVCFPWGDEDAREDVGAGDCVVNATSLGLEYEDPMPVPAEWLNPASFVFDLIYRPQRTRWIQEALRRGCKASGGAGMLLHQGALAFQLWSGQKPPIEVMRKVLLRDLKG